MKRNTVSLLLLIALTIVAACSSSKKTANSTPAVSSAKLRVTTSTTPETPAPTIVVKPANGIFAPGQEELTAIQVTYSEVSMQTLAEGHAIYVGVCTNCHIAKNIYSRPVERWSSIIEDMAPKSKLTDAQKDAVYKYVLAIKATQSKEVKSSQTGFPSYYQD
jgi:cytochrome c1